MADMWSILEKTHQKRKIASATSETSVTRQITFVHEIVNQQLNIDGFDQSNANDECMLLLKPVEFNIMHQIVVSFQVKRAQSNNEQNNNYKWNVKLSTWISILLIVNVDMQKHTGKYIVVPDCIIG